MPLTSEQLEKLKKWFDSKNISLKCSTCWGTKWTPGEIIAATTYKNKLFEMGRPIVPMVQSVCDYCGFIKLYSAIRIGIVN